MCAGVVAEVDPLTSAVDPREQRGDELVLAPDEGVDRAVVVGVRMDVEQACVPGERSADRVDRRAVASLGEVRHGLQRQHRPGAYAPLR